MVAKLLFVFLASIILSACNHHEDKAVHTEANKPNPTDVFLRNFEGVWSSDLGEPCYLGVNAEAQLLGVACRSGGLSKMLDLWNADKYKILKIDESQRSVTAIGGHKKYGESIITIRMVDSSTPPNGQFYLVIIWGGGSVTNLNVFARKLLEQDADLLNRKIEETSGRYAAWEQADAEKEKKKQPQEPRKFNPSFNCLADLNIVEKQICDSENLARLDVALNNAYNKRSPSPGERERQLNWIKNKRNVCAYDNECILNAMKIRILELSEGG